MQKAYKLLALQENISNNEAKELIDAGLVSAKGQKLIFARALMSEKTTFKVLKLAKPSVIFEDNNVLAVSKPAFMVSEKIAQDYAKKDANITLLNRLDKDTSGVLLLAKNALFKERAIAEYKAKRVKKVYFAIVNGLLVEPLRLDLPLSTTRTGSGAITKIDLKNGKQAITLVEPYMCEGKKSLVKISIETGRTHQIRVHLAHAGYGILGESKYAKSKGKRIYLHAYETSIASRDDNNANLQAFNYHFRAPLTRDFSEFFDLPRELIN